MFFVEGISFFGVALADTEAVVADVVVSEVNPVGVPFNGVGVEILPGFVAFSLFVIGGMFSVAMEVSVDVNVFRVFSDEFEDVDFAATGPTDGINIVAKDPDGGPDSGALRDFGADFDLAEFPTRESLGVKAGRGVIDFRELLFGFVLQGLGGG